MPGFHAAAWPGSLALVNPSPLTVWHEAIAQNDLTAFEAIIADDAVFLSPALHRPQPGKAMVAMYLRGAMAILNNGTFRYTSEWVGPRSAVLEFEARIDGLDINGVDILHWDDDGKVTQFKVMVRPFKALTALMASMARLLEAVKAGG